MIAAALMSYNAIAANGERSAHQHEEPALAFAVAGQLVMRALIEAPITRKLIEYPRFLATAIRESIKSYVDQDLSLAIEQGRFSPNMQGPLLDSAVLWALVGILIDTIENDRGVDESLIYFTQIHLIFLGVSREEAEDLSKQAVSYSLLVFEEYI